MSYQALNLVIQIRFLGALPLITQKKMRVYEIGTGYHGAAKG